MSRLGRVLGMVVGGGVLWIGAQALAGAWRSVLWTGAVDPVLAVLGLVLAALGIGMAVAAVRTKW